MTDDIQLELLRIYEAFPENVTPSSEALGSHLHGADHAAGRSQSRRLLGSAAAERAAAVRI